LRCAFKKKVSEQTRNAIPGALLSEDRSSAANEMTRINPDPVRSSRQHACPRAGDTKVDPFAMRFVVEHTSNFLPGCQCFGPALHPVASPLRSSHNLPTMPYYCAVGDQGRCIDLLTSRKRP
jgi:hypothetical protein